MKDSDFSYWIVCTELKFFNPLFKLNVGISILFFILLTYYLLTSVYFYVLLMNIQRYYSLPLNFGEYSPFAGKDSADQYKNAYGKFSIGSSSSL